MKFKIALVLFLVSSASLYAQQSPSSDYRLHFRKGDEWRVDITEVLRLMMHFPQVEEGDRKPSIRTTEYSFTERIDSVLPDGSAIMAATLDSFKTRIAFGDGKRSEDFFHFSSAVDWDLEHTLRDIKTLPRAQFLGQTLRYTLMPDGTIKNFQNLADFHQNAVGQGYDYDMVHAMLSLADSLRMGQLLEIGFGGLAAAKQKYISASTATEIPVTRTVMFTPNGKHTGKVTAIYSNAPARIEYLEGIATPMGILKFAGRGEGEVSLKDGFLKHATYHDSANVLLAIDVDTVPEEISRQVTIESMPIPVLRLKHGGRVEIKEIESHHEAPKDVDENGEERHVTIDSTRRSENH
jgi:hypothetical protein